MAKHDCDIFLPVVDRGRTWMLATRSGHYTQVDILGEDLWMSSPRIEDQSRLASTFGGALADIGLDGLVRRWLNHAYSCDREEVGRKLLGAGATQAKLLDVGRWLDEAESGRVPAPLQKLFDAVPIQRRMGRGLGIGAIESRLLSTALPSPKDLFASRALAPVPILTGEASATLISSMLASFYEDEFLDIAMSFEQRYLFAQGRWLTTLRMPDTSRRVRSSGSTPKVAWVPVSQALAGSNYRTCRFVDESAARDGIAALDRSDLLLLARAARPCHFFQGSPEARAWVDQAEMDAATPTAKASGRIATL